MKGYKMGEIEIFIKSLRDFFTKPILKLALYPLIVTLVIMYALFFVVADFGLDNFQNHVHQVQQQHVLIENGEVVSSSNVMSEEYFGKSVIEFLLRYSITSWLVSFLVYSLGTIFVISFSLFITLIVVGFLTPFILKIIQQKHYKELEFKGYGNIFNTFWILIKSFMVMLFLLIILIPLYFIPVLNIFILNIPFYYFFYKLLNFDITSTLMTKQEEAIIRVKNGSAFHFKTMLLYLISMIPFIVLFATVFYVIYLGHGYMLELKKLRENKQIEDTNYSI